MAPPRSHEPAIPIRRVVLLAPCSQSFADPAPAITFSMLLDALNHHRGKSQQKIMVEHVHVDSSVQVPNEIIQKLNATRAASPSAKRTRPLRPLNPTSRPGHSLFRRSAAALALLVLPFPSNADPAPTIHYAPAENLEHIDVVLIDRAKHEIDMAAYVLTDWPSWMRRCCAFFCTSTT
jgi:hypothetical protein